MKISIGLISFFTFIIAGTACSQVTINALNSAHRSALSSYLRSNPSRSFRSQSELEEEYLLFMTETFGISFMPNYGVDDFNQDKLTDFAVLLNRKGRPKWLTSDRTQFNDHNPERPLTLVVFNGKTDGTFSVAFTKDLIGPLASFVFVDRGEKNLYYGIYETDSDTFLLVPNGKTYKIKEAEL